VTDYDDVPATYLTGSSARHGRTAAYDDFADDEDWSADTGAPMGLVSLAFLTAAIRRSLAFCCVVAVAGFLIGCGLNVADPAPYKASTSVLLTYGPYESTTSGSTDDQSIAETRTVAALALHKLGLNKSVDSFLSEYSVTITSNRVFLITFSAPSGSEAVSGAGAVATAFLQFRAGLLQQEQVQALASLERQVTQAQQQVSSLTSQINAITAQHASAADHAKLTSLRAQRTQESATLTNLQQTVSGDETTNQPITAAAIQGSEVLDPAALIPRSHIKTLVLYPGAGLVAGLALAVILVLIRAVISDRPRRRDEVAQALGASVKLSLGPLPKKRRGSGREADIRRIAVVLGRALPEVSAGPAALAVVAVDDAASAALPLVSLGTSWAKKGKRVVVADLAAGAPAAKLLGVREPGVAPVSLQDGRLVVAVPKPQEVAPNGPLGRSLAWEQRSSFTDAVAAAAAKADLLLTLVTLDPSLDCDHLPTWAADAVVILTAGQSSWTRLRAVGEMIRLSGTNLVSAVLVGTDRTDESLGLVLDDDARQPSRSGDNKVLVLEAERDLVAGNRVLVSQDSTRRSSAESLGPVLDDEDEAERTDPNIMLILDDPTVRASVSPAPVSANEDEDDEPGQPAGEADEDEGDDEGDDDLDVDLDLDDQDEDDEDDDEDDEDDSLGLVFEPSDRTEVMSLVLEPRGDRAAEVPEQPAHSDENGFHVQGRI
jgi:hypothetical protein